MSVFAKPSSLPRINTSSSASSSSSPLQRDKVCRRWMTLLAMRSPSFCSAPITLVPMVGAHDAGTSGIAPNGASPLAADLPENLKSIPGFLQGTLRKHVSNWSKTQSCCTLEQLEEGVRYFDIRLSPHVEQVLQHGQKKEAIYVSHGAVAIPLRAFVSQVLLFYENEEEEEGGAESKNILLPTGLSSVANVATTRKTNLETIVIDIQHVTAFRAHHYVMLEEDLRPLQHLLVPSSACDLSTPLSTVWATQNGNGRIFLLSAAKPPSSSSAASPLHALLFPRSDLTIRSHWKNRQKIEDLVSDLTYELKVQARCPLEERHQLHVSQCVLTPTSKEIIAGLLPRPRFSCVRDLVEKQAVNVKVLELWETFEAMSGYPDECFNYEDAKRAADKEKQQRLLQQQQQQKQQQQQQSQVPLPPLRIDADTDVFRETRRRGGAQPAAAAATTAATDDQLLFANEGKRGIVQSPNGAVVVVDACRFDLSAATSGPAFDPRGVLMLDYYEEGRSPSGRDAVALCLALAIRRFSCVGADELLAAVSNSEVVRVARLPIPAAPANSSSDAVAARPAIAVRAEFTPAAAPGQHAKSAEAANKEMNEFDL